MIGTKKRNKVLSWLLTFAMLMTFIPSFTLTASAAEEPATITGVTVTVGGVEYTGSSEEEPITITPATVYIDFTVHGTNLKNGSGQNIIQCFEHQQSPVKTDRLEWEFSEDGTTATLSLSNDWAVGCTNSEVLFTNDGWVTTQHTGIFLSYDASEFVKVNLKLKAVDTEGNAIAGKLDALSNPVEEWVGTDDCDYTDVFFFIGENTLTDWDYCPYGYAKPTEDITFNVDAGGNITITSNNATVEPGENGVYYIVVTLEANTPPFLPDDTAGKIIVLMADSYGDGWNGAAINIYANDTLVGTATIEGEEDSFVFEMAYDSSVEYRFAWVSGLYDYECIYKIYINGEEYTGELDTDECPTVTITGNPVVGQTLTAETSGFNAAELIYQWYKVAEDNILINGATESTYTLTEDELYQDIYCVVNGVESNHVGSVVASGSATNNLWVGGVQVTKDNKYDVLGDGTVSYDPNTKTLTLEGANITSTDNYGIYADAMDGFTIALTGVNTINSDAAAAIYVKQREDYHGEAITITGDGSLNAICGAATAESYGIYAEGDVIVESGEVNITGGNYGISSSLVFMEDGTVTATGADCGIFGDVIILGGAVTATGTSTEGYGIIGWLGVMGGAVTATGGRSAFVFYGDNAPTLVMTMPLIMAGTSAADANRIDQEDLADSYKTFTEGGDDYTYTTYQYVSISEDNSYYPVSVGGVAVSEENKTDVLSDGGSVAYDPDTNTLTLKGANITGIANDTPSMGVGILAMSGLNLKLVGENTVTGQQVMAEGEMPMSLAIAVMGNLTISGSGSLDAQAADLEADGTSFCIQVQGSITINGGSLTATGGEITGTGGESCGVNSYGNINVSGGSLTATGGEVTDGVSYGIWSETVTVTGGTIIAQGETAAFENAPTISDTFTDAAVWYGDDEIDAGQHIILASDITDEELYYSKYVRIVGATIEANGTDVDGIKANATVFIPKAGTYTLIFADYEGTELNNVDIVTVTTESNNTVTTVTSEIDITLGTGDKIMLWQDMTNLVPLCDAYIVK